MIHRNYYGAHAAGQQVSLEEAAKEVLDYFAARDAAIAERARRTQPTQDPKPAPPTLRPTAARVSISNEPGSEKKSSVVRDRNGKVDVNKTMAQAGKEMNEMMRQRRAASP